MSTQVEATTRVLRAVELRRPAAVPAIGAVSPRPRLPIERTIEALRGPFRPLVVWALFWGGRPFSELMRHVPDVTKKSLRRELAELERLSLVVRDVPPGSNRRATYSLSPLGETLRPVVGAMYEWGLLCAQPRRPSHERMRATSGA